MQANKDYEAIVASAKDFVIAELLKIQALYKNYNSAFSAGMMQDLAFENLLESKKRYLEKLIEMLQ